MNGIKDFQAPQYVDIVHPDKGFFGYLLRCKCPKQEDVSGNFIFLDDGIDFIDFMTCGSNDAVRIFLEKFTAEVRASAIYDGLKPLYAVSHVCQLSADNRMQWPHIHVLWGIKKN